MKPVSILSIAIIGSILAGCSNNSSPIASLEKLTINDPQDIRGYKFTSYEIDRATTSNRAYISLEVSCEGNFTQKWVQITQGLDDDIQTIVGNEYHIENVTGLNTTPVPRLRYVGVDKFDQQADGNIYYGKDNSNYLVTNESCFNDYACENGFLLKSIERTEECN